MELRTETTRLSPAETAKYLLLCKIVSREQSREESLESGSNAGPRQIAIAPASAGEQNSAYKCLQKNESPPPKRGIFYFKKILIYKTRTIPYLQIIIVRKIVGNFQHI